MRIKGLFYILVILLLALGSILLYLSSQINALFFYIGEGQTADEQIYHCGASSKDGGNKVTTITAVTDGAIYHPVIDQLIQNPVLTLR